MHIFKSIGLIEFFDNIYFNSMLTEQELDKLRKKVLDEHVGSFLSNMNIVISDPFEIIDCGNSYEDCINHEKILDGTRIVCPESNC